MKGNKYNYNNFTTVYKRSCLKECLLICRKLKLRNLYRIAKLAFLSCFPLIQTTLTRFKRTTDNNIVLGYTIILKIDLFADPLTTRRILLGWAKPGPQLKGAAEAGKRGESRCTVTANIEQHWLGILKYFRRRRLIPHFGPGLPTLDSFSSVFVFWLFLLCPLSTGGPFRGALHTLWPESCCCLFTLCANCISGLPSVQEPANLLQSRTGFVALVLAVSQSEKRKTRRLGREGKAAETAEFCN